MTWAWLCSPDQVWQGEAATFDAGDAAVLLVHLEDDSYRAYDGRCPHQQVSLADAALTGYELTCSAHCWRFDVRDGSSINPRGKCLTRYPVECRDDGIYVDI